MSKEIRLDVFKKTGMLAECKCGGGYVETMEAITPFGPFQESRKYEAGYYHIIASHLKTKGLTRPIYSVACLACKDTYGSAFTIEEAVQKFMTDDRKGVSVD